MTPQQASALFLQVLEENGLQSARIGNRLKQHFGRLHNLTPGDFATVLRQFRAMARTIHPDTLLHALEQECKAKADGNQRPIGFIH